MELKPKELTIAPAPCHDSADGPATWAGAVTVLLPSVPAIMKFRARYGKKLFVGEKASESSDIRQFELMDLLGDLSEDIYPFIKSVDLKELATGKEIKSVDDLFYYEPATGIIADVAMKFVKGFAEKN